MIYQLDPLTDARWQELVRSHPKVSIFHTVGWLRAIEETFAYSPIVLTTSRPGAPLDNGVALCRINSWLTGRRLVSLPFSDHCEPLVHDEGHLTEIVSFLEARAREGHYKYVELRPADVVIGARPAWQISQAFYLHRLNLGKQNPSGLYLSFHKGCVRRRISRAIKESIEIRRGRSSDILNDFYGLVIKTRRRQGLLPQPNAWFAAILNHLAHNSEIYCAYKEGRPIAAILALRFRKTLYYKYGASDAHFHRIGAMPYLLWMAIQDAIESGLDELDMGRTDYANASLATFKDRWNTSRFPLSYWRTPASAPSPLATKLPTRITTRAFAYLPATGLRVLGDFCYRHAG